MPEKTGCREWEAFKEQGWLWNTSQDYFGAAVVKDTALGTILCVIVHVL